jgi:Carboxypeptidase regulatory-like domain
MNKNIFVFLIISVVLSACQGKEGPVGPSLTGDVVGTVKVIDTAGNNANLNGVLIQLEGTQYSAYSDSTGLWRLVGVKTGTYVLSCSRQGFSTAKNTSFQVVGGPQPADASYFYLYQIPSTYVKLLDPPQLNQHVLTLTGRLSSIPGPNYSHAIFVFVGIDSSATSLPIKYLTAASQYFAPADTFNIQLNFDYFGTVGLKRGSKLYFVAYTSANTYAGYWDVATQKFVYSGLCSTPSNIVSLIVP